MSAAIATGTRETTAAQLGRTLMYERLTIAYPGFESHTTHGGLGFAGWAIDGLAVENACRSLEGSQLDAPAWNGR